MLALAFCRWARYHEGMSGVLIALFAAAGVGGWVYSKINRRSGGNTQTDIVVTGLVAAFAFLIVWSVFAMFG